MDRTNYNSKYGSNFFISLLFMNPKVKKINLILDFPNSCIYILHGLINVLNPLSI